MQFTPLASMELFVVLAFLIGWLILERVARRLDRKRQEDQAAASDEKSSDSTD